MRLFFRDSDLVDSAKLVKRLQDFPKRLQGQAIRPALRASAKTILARAKANAPVYKHPKKKRRRKGSPIVQQRPRTTPLPKPRTLRNSLKARAMKRSRNRNGMVIGTGKSAKGFQGQTFYGAFLEFGTKSKNGRVHIAPRRFLKMSYRQSRTASLQAMKYQLTIGLRRAAASKGSPPAEGPPADVS
jgi:HK97 gp10 family phage protein